MARGKQTCKILKEIRRQIAEANGIEFATSECRYKGDCLGTCPKCEAEVRYLEQQLRSRSLAGKAVALAGISTGMILMSGCSGTSTNNQTNDDILGEFIESPEMIEEIEDIEEGELPMLEDSIACIDNVKEGKVFSTELKTTGEIPDILAANPDEHGIYAVADQYPEFPGGIEKMMQFIAHNLRYPETCTCVQGRVIVRFYVDTLGHVCDPTVFKGMDPVFDAEALRVVKLMPDFKPGKIKGKNVKVWLSVPISFKLSGYSD